MLLRIFAAALAVVFLTAATVANPMPPPISPVVQIDGGCTGFHIGDGFLVTAGHCVSKIGGGFAVVAEDGTAYGGTLSMYSHHTLGDDIALIRITPPANLGVALLDCGPSPPTGTEIHMTGYPAEYGLSSVWGRVAGAPRGYSNIGGWRDALPVNISSFGGFSGSPVMTEDGKVIGILVGHMTANPSLAMAVPAYRVCEFIGAGWVA